MLSVTCAIIELNGKVLCAQRSKKMNLPLKWELPGGKVELNETPEDCLIREITEELGLNIEIIRQLPAFKHKYPKREKIELLPFICKIKSGELILKEHQQVNWLYKNELFSLDWAEADIAVVEYYINEWLFQ